MSAADLMQKLNQMGFPITVMDRLADDLTGLQTKLHEKRKEGLTPAETEEVFVALSQLAHRVGQVRMTCKLSVFGGCRERELRDLAEAFDYKVEIDYRVERVKIDKPETQQA